MAECTGFQEDPAEDSPHVTSPQESWRIFVDGSSNKNGSGAGIILISPKGHRFHSVLRFGFKASNNEAKYKALLAGLRVAQELKASSVQCFSDSQLVVNQVLGEYQARGARMAAYLAKVTVKLSTFERGSIEQIPREQNSNADALAKLATSEEMETLGLVPVEFLEKPSIEEVRAEVEMIDARPTWMTPILEYLTAG